jgi:hypothetical protein
MRVSGQPALISQRSCGVISFGFSLSLIVVIAVHASYRSILISLFNEKITIAMKNNHTMYRALSDLFSLAVLSGNAAWNRSFLARERGEEGEWDEWEGGGRTKEKVTHVSST